MFKYYIGGVDPNTGGAYSKGYKLHNYTNPSRKAWITDSGFTGDNLTYSFSVTDQASMNVGGVSYVENTGAYVNRTRHGLCANVLFPDGHVDTMTEIALRGECKSKPYWSQTEMFGSPNIQ